MICYRYIYTWCFFGRAWNLVDAINQDFDVLWKLLAKPNSSSGTVNSTLTVGLSETEEANRSA
jgi:hypothetical protein